MIDSEQKSQYICAACRTSAWLGFYEAQRLGWWWERRVGHVYDYYCPKCDPRKRSRDTAVLTSRIF